MEFEKYPIGEGGPKQTRPNLRLILGALRTEVKGNSTTLRAVAHFGGRDLSPSGARRVAGQNPLARHNPRDQFYDSTRRRVSRLTSVLRIVRVIVSKYRLQSREIGFLELIAEDGRIVPAVVPVVVVDAKSRLHSGACEWLNPTAPPAKTALFYCQGARVHKRARNRIRVLPNAEFSLP